MTQRTRLLLVFATVVAAGMVAATLLSPTSARLAEEHPEAEMLLSLPVVDSLAPVLSRCFEKPIEDVLALNWFVTDSSLGLSDAGGGDPAGARYYRADTAVLVRRFALQVPSILDHEIRHHLADQEGRHPSAVFDKQC